MCSFFVSITGHLIANPGMYRRHNAGINNDRDWSRRVLYIMPQDKRYVLSSTPPPGSNRDVPSLVRLCDFNYTRIRLYPAYSPTLLTAHLLPCQLRAIMVEELSAHVRSRTINLLSSQSVASSTFTSPSSPDHTYHVLYCTRTFFGRGKAH
jgi:hypothetical protein